jgi:metal-responsive CopG/Arc/MetJ family transcriptional regulator
MTMKTAISMPDSVFKTAERFARQRKLSRSALFTQAVKEFLQRRNSEAVTEQLNQIYAAEESRLDSVAGALQMISLAPEKW